MNPTDPRNRGWTQAHTAEGKRQRQKVFLHRLSLGEDVDEVKLDLGIGKNTWENWRWPRKTRGDGFEQALKEALHTSRGTDEFPSFLNFRARHFAYRDIRAVKNVNTNRLPFVRATNSFYQVDAVKQMAENNRLLMILPPGHIKTTLWCIEYPTYLIMRDRNVRILSVTKSQPEAKKIIASVQERLQCEWYHNIIQFMTEQGDVVPIECPVCAYAKGKPFKQENRKMESNSSWGADGFRVMGVDSGEKDLTMQAKGVGSQLQGIRSDLILLDDIQDPEEGRKNPGASKDLVSWVNDVPLGRITDTQQLVVLANFFSPDDFAHKLMQEKDEIFGLVKYPAIVNENSRQVLCPEFWTWDALMSKKREVGPSTWHYTWMQEDQSFEHATFRREALEAACDESLKLGDIPYGVSDIFVGVDPAQAASGFCAIVVWALDKHSKQRYLIDVFNQSGMRTWDNVTDQILEFCRTYPVRKVIVEGNNTQKSITNSEYFRREVSNTGARYEVYQTISGTGGRSKQSNFDITTIGGLFDDGLITLPYGGTLDDQARVNDYIDQLCNWRTDDEGHSIKYLVRDMVMATLFAESEAFVLANRARDKVVQPISSAPSWAKSAWLRNPREQYQSAFSRNEARISRAMSDIDQLRESALDGAGDK